MSAVLLFALSANAADVDPFRPSGSLPSGQGTLQGESPYLLGNGFSGGLFASFAEDLAIRDFGERSEPLVRSVLPVEVYGSWTIEERARIEVFVPLYAHVDAPASDFDGPAFGDLRFQANVPIWQGERVRFSMLPRIELPTGTTDAFTKRGFQLGLSAVVGGDTETFGWVGNAGFTASKASDFFGVGTGSAFELLGGGWWKASQGFRLGAEAETQLGLASGTQGSNVLATGHLFGQTTLPSGLGLTVGAGTGLIGGVGAPGYRLFAALTYGSTVQDRDGDTILDPDDSCPTEPEDFDGFEDIDGCPDPDNDNDTIVDVRDGCPDVPEDLDGYEDDNGCPDPDNDGDGVLDEADACPLVPGIAALQGCPDEDSDGDGIYDSKDACPDIPGIPEFDGCPDRDGDKVPDARDACPDDPIDAGDDPATSDGCPKLVFVSGEQIKIGQRVEFRTGSADLDPQSFPLLNAVASLLGRHPEIRKVEVAGHTDNVGSDTYNQKLSQRRAQSVLDHLKLAGVARNRLVSKGYGEAEPMTTNRTPDGRANNRRVEFNILEREAPVLVPVPKSPAPKPAPQEFEPDADDLSNPWDVEGTPRPAPKPIPVENPSDLANPWDAGEPEPRPVPKPAPVPAPAPVPVPAPVSAPDSELANPWGTVLSPSEAPDPLGRPGRLTIYLRGIDEAEVYLDNERLPRDAPFERLPIPAGEHRIWVTNKSAGLDFESTLLIQNAKEQILLLPPGRAERPVAPSDEPAPVVPEPPPPAPSKRPGRRSKKLPK